MPSAEEQGQRTGATAGGHLAILELSSMCYQFFYGAGGDHESALRGLCETLWNLRNEPIAYLAAAVDRPGPTFRSALLPQYKAHRPPKPQPMVDFLKASRMAVEAFGIPLVDWEGHEADDAIASATAAAAAAGVTVSIMSIDKDFWQLVRPGVTCLSRMRGVTTRYDEAAVLAKAGVRPQQIPDLLAIAGDASDNIPGVDGIGAARAAQLLSALGSVEAILATPRYAIRAIPRIKKLAWAVHDAADAVRLYLQVATLATRPLDVATLALQPIDRWRLGEFLDTAHPALMGQIREAGR